MRDGGIDALTQIFIDRTTDAQQDPTADDIQDALKRKQAGGEQGEPDQRRDAPARQDPIVDLEHEQRRGEHQDIDEAAQEPDRHEGMPAALQRLSQLRSWGLLLFHLNHE
jgi:hypothetical protein